MDAAAASRSDSQPRRNAALYADVGNLTAMLDVAVDAFATTFGGFESRGALRELKATPPRKELGDIVASARSHKRPALVLSDFTQKAICSLQEQSEVGYLTIHNKFLHITKKARLHRPELFIFTSYSLFDLYVAFTLGAG